MTATINESGLCVQAIMDAAMQAQMQPWIEMECYQLGQGARLGKMESLDLGDRQVVRECLDAPVQKIGVMPANLCTISYCTPAPTFRFSDMCASDTDTIFFMPEHTEFDLYVPAGAQTAYVSLDQDAFMRGAQALNPVQWERAPRQVLSIRSTQQAALKNLVDLSLQAAGTGSTGGNLHYEKILCDMLLHDVLQIATAAGANETQPSSIERTRALQVCQMARALVDARLAVDEIPTIVDICTTVGVSERTLQYAFRTYVDMSPMAYLRLCRLNRVRAMLRMADPSDTTITVVAMRFGFVHLGRFSSDYKRVFGESPSVTLVS